jgi:hypothetical protein
MCIDPLKEVLNSIDDLITVVSSSIEEASLIFFCIAVLSPRFLAQMPCIHKEGKFIAKSSEKLKEVG